MGRQCVMFSAFPRWAPRIGHGQRSGQGQQPAIVFLSKTRVLRGNSNYHLQPLPIVVAGSSGTMSAHADIRPQYIEKVVAVVPAVFGGMGDEVTTMGGTLLLGSEGYLTQERGEERLPLSRG